MRLIDADELKKRAEKVCFADIPDCGDFDAVGADLSWADAGLEYDTPLLAPDACSALYVHWLCAQMDLALGETARAVNELQMYSDSVQEFAAWMRRRYAPAGGAQWRY